MTREQVQRWLDSYLEAWKSSDRASVEALFSQDVSYRYHPYDEPIVGRAAVVASWLDDVDQDGTPTRDAPGTFDGSYHPVVVDGEFAVAVGVSTYTDGPGGPVKEVYDNCWVLRFDADARCREFTEWYMKRPATNE
jgi:ketosteroid isomerase-like protein